MSSPPDRFMWHPGDLRPSEVAPSSIDGSGCLPAPKGGDITLWLWRCDAGHLHARAECGGIVRESRADASFLPGNLKDYVPCRDERGRFAPCGGGINAAGREGKPRQEHAARQQEAHGKVQHLVAEMKAGHATPGKMKALAGELSKMTVAQIKGLAAEHSLKAPAGRKEDLVNGLAARFHAAYYKEKAAGTAEAPPAGAPAAGASPHVAPHAPPLVAPVTPPAGATAVGKPLPPAPQPDPLKGRPVPFSDAQAHGWGKSAYSGWASSLSSDENSALQGYKGISQDVNDHLRDAAPAPEDGWERHDYDQRERQIAHIDSALSRGRTDRDVIVYRGLRNQDVAREVTGNVGGTFTDKAYQSTSASPKQAEVFTRGATDKRQSVLWEIHVPKGSKGAYVDAKPNANDHEREFLLPRNSKIRILSVEKRGNVHHVKGRLEE